MSSIEINSANSTYTVNFRTNLIHDNPDHFYLIDEFVYAKFQNQLPDVRKVFLVPGAESTKTITKVEWLFGQMAERGMSKNSTLVAIGGGSIQDLATLAAALYMRGIKWQYVPSTLMSMVDSCIGGKSAINVGSFKNIVGNFYPPKEITINVELLKELSMPAIISGLCEAIKINIARGAENYTQFKALYKEYVRTSDLNKLTELIQLTLNAKKWFVEIDEFDLKERKMLNYGHSFGHALESATDMQIPHGIAVGAGMLVANHFGAVTKYSEEISLDVRSLLNKSEFDFSAIHFDSQLFAKSLLKDKKNSSEVQNLILLQEDGSLNIVGLPKSQGHIEEQVSVMKSILSELGVRT